MRIHVAFDQSFFRARLVVIVVGVGVIKKQNNSHLHHNLHDGFDVAPPMAASTDAANARAAAVLIVSSVFTPVVVLVVVVNDNTSRRRAVSTPHVSEDSIDRSAPRGSEIHHARRHPSENESENKGRNKIMWRISYVISQIKSKV